MSMYFGIPDNPYTFNYNIIVKITNGPIKNFFYKDSCHYERYSVVEEGIKELVKNLYDRDFDLDISVLPNIKDNENKYTGIELIKTGTFSGDFKIKSS